MRFYFLLFIGLCAIAAANAELTVAGRPPSAQYACAVACGPQLGDVVFTRIGGPIFTHVADATGSWTSHVGIIVDFRNGDWVVAESGVPSVRETPLRKFLSRSEGGKFGICRLRQPLTREQEARLRRLAEAQLGRRYSLGFDLNGSGTFCSKYVHELVAGATGCQVGQAQTFGQLLQSNPRAPATFWRIWFLGRVPLDRVTLTPASMWNSPALVTVAQYPLN